MPCRAMLGSTCPCVLGLPSRVRLGSLNSRQVLWGWEKDLVKAGSTGVRMLLHAQVLTGAAGSVGSDMLDVTYW